MLLRDKCAVFLASVRRKASSNGVFSDATCSSSIASHCGQGKWRSLDGPEVGGGPSARQRGLERGGIQDLPGAFRFALDAARHRRRTFPLGSVISQNPPHHVPQRLSQSVTRRHTKPNENASRKSDQDSSVGRLLAPAPSSRYRPPRMPQRPHPAPTPLDELMSPQAQATPAFRMATVSWPGSVRMAGRLSRPPFLAAPSRNATFAAANRQLGYWTPGRGAPHTDWEPMKRRTLKRLRPGRQPEHHHHYYLPATCFAAAACCFFWAAALVLSCFCAACFCTDFGDLSPIITLPFLDGLLPGSV